MAAHSNLLDRKKTHFVLWRPAHVSTIPALVIGIFRPGNPPVLTNQQHIPLVQSTAFPELWEIPASTLGLANGQVYHYWFRLKDSNPETGRDKVIDVTDPFATCVDWRIVAPQLDAPYTDQDRDPAGVVIYKDGELIPGDPGGGTSDWNGDASLASLPANNRLVLYELPTRWTRIADEGAVEVGVGTFRDVLALVMKHESGANFEGMPALSGRAHLQELGVNALELLPPADSFVSREWGYATSNYLAADFDLGFPEGNASPTATTDLVNLIRSCHQAGIRFFLDAVMAFATHASQENINFLDFHVLRGTGDPEEDQRQDFGGTLLKYNFRVDGYDPVSGENSRIVPSRQWMQTFLMHWMRFYRVDGVRMDSVVNFNNWDFIREFKDHGRALWNERWVAQNGNSPGSNKRFLVIGEELAVPLDLIRQQRLDALWNEKFKHLLRNVLLGGAGLSNDDFFGQAAAMIDCRRLGFTDGAQAVNYVTSHDVEGFRNERLYNFLENNHLAFKEKPIKLAFVCLLTAVGIPMIFAGEEFADEHDLPVIHPHKQTDPVNFRRLEDPWRKRIFDYVARLTQFRTLSNGLSVNETEFIHADFTPGRRVLAWKRGSVEDTIVVVANFSDWGTNKPEDPSAEYRIAHWPALVLGRKWREITQARDVPETWAGREPLYPMEAKVYAMVSAV